MQNRSVLISGAGVAGPTLAWWLLAHGFKPTLVERAPRLRENGYVIDFWGLGYEVAERMGLLPQVEAAGYHVRELRLVGDDGRRVGGFDTEAIRRLAGGRFVSLQRSALSRMIFDAVEGRCETIFGDSLTALEEDDDGVLATFETTKPRRFDLVVGADGLHSRTRKLVFGPQKRFESYLGYVVAAFETRGYPHRNEDAYVSHASPGRQIARFAMRDDRTLFLFVVATPDAPAAALADADAQKAWLHEQFGATAWESREILAALDDSDDLYFDRVSQIRMDRWSCGRTVLVGDAAFCPSLLAGQGSALAMAAAYVLAGELAKAGGRPDLAYFKYETRLRDFIVGKQRAASAFANAFVPKTQMGIAARNLVTRLFDLPGVARLAMGPSLTDRMDLPDYPRPPAA